MPHSEVWLQGLTPRRSSSLSTEASSSGLMSPRSFTASGMYERSPKYGGLVTQVWARIPAAAQLRMVSRQSPISIMFMVVTKKPPRWVAWGWGGWVRRQPQPDPAGTAPWLPGPGPRWLRRWPGSHPRGTAAQRVRGQRVQNQGRAGLRPSRSCAAGAL